MKRLRIKWREVEIEIWGIPSWLLITMVTGGAAILHAQGWM